MPASQLLSIPEVCERLRISRSHLYDLFAEGELPWVRIGRRRCVPEQALDDYVSERLEQAGGGDAA